MLDPKNISDIVQQVLASLPPGLRELPKELEDNLRAAMQGVFQKMDLVTRDEFNAQVGVLHKTRSKLEQLEQQLLELEAKQRP